MLSPRLVARVLPAMTVLLVVVLVGSSPPSATSTVPSSSADRGYRLPPADAAWDYQIGGARRVPPGARVVVRDRAARPAGRYPVCYVNAFQTQPTEARFWRTGGRWRLVLKDRAGRPVRDSVWGEWLLDTRSPAKRHALARIVGRWVQGCAEAGFDAVEYDNLDSYTRSHGRLHRAHNVAYARLITRAAHGAGLAAAQKNTAELAPRGPALGFDFAVVEDCARWDECAVYARAYADRAFLVEYDVRQWRRACRRVGRRVSVTLRDRMVTPKGPYRSC